MADGLYPRDAVIRRVDGEGVLLLGGGRALLMQLAHPAVAAGVADHSEFAADPFARLRRTLEASYTMVFGSEEEARRTAAAVRAVHERVRGPGYSANDPSLLLWVHATLVDTSLRVYTRFVRPLSRRDLDEFYEQSSVQAELLGCPRSHQPTTYDDFRDYVRTMVASLEVSDTARTLARDVLHPRVPWFSEPVFELGRQMTVGLLPGPLRGHYGLAWDPVRSMALTAASLASRQVVPRLPAAVRRAPAPTFA